MFKRKKTNTRYQRRRSERQLHLQVSSPRIVFFQSLRALKGVTKLGLVTLFLVVGGIYASHAIQKHLKTNPEYSLRHLQVTPNPVLSVSRVAEIAEIDSDGTIFAVSIDDAEARLSARPEVVSVEVRRHLPDTIKVDLVVRQPVCWLACPTLGMAGRNPLSGILMDEEGVVFRCEGDLWTVARHLPVIEVTDGKKEEFHLGRKIAHADAKRALALIKLINTREISGWSVRRVKVIDFYQMLVVSDDQVDATFGMYEHERQLNDLLAARKHAKDKGKELSWINLLPRHNIPGNFKDIGTDSSEL